ncbi:hypothetical protein [Thomasclavelia cocleata]|uniref:hypothetical protein n=1 Tax=Thomasclavelia cocleata TaxID=69824 RepID=UPI00272E1C4E|nr:hypothetical protein [Thomasclavelia cocleata]
MKFLDNILEKFGSQNVIIVCVSILVIIIGIIVYRAIKLKMYRKEIVELENQMNAIKTLPIQYRLGRVKVLVKTCQKYLKNMKYMKLNLMN